MSIGLFLICLNLLFLIIFKFLVFKNKEVIALVFITLCLDLCILVYRFRYRNYVLDFETFVGFYLIFSYTSFFFVLILSFILSKEQKHNLMSVSKKVKYLTRNHFFKVIDSFERISFLKTVFYFKLEFFFREFITKPKLLTSIFVIIPWILFLLVFFYETIKGEGFWYSLYFSAFRIVILRLREGIFFILNVTTYNHTSWNALLLPLGSVSSDLLIAKAQSIELNRDLICNPGTDVKLEVTEVLDLFKRIANILYFSSLHVWATRINDFYYYKAKSFIQNINLIIFSIIFVLYFVFNSEYYYTFYSFVVFSLLLIIILLYNFVYDILHSRSIIINLIEKQKIIPAFLKDFVLFLTHAGIDPKDLIVEKDETLWYTQVPESFTSIVLRKFANLKVIFWKFW